MAPKSSWVTVGKQDSTSLYWQLGKSDEHKDLKFDLIKVTSDPKNFNSIPPTNNYKENQPMTEKKTW